MKFDINKVDLSEMDAVFEEWQKNTGVSLNDTTVLKLKEEIRVSYEFIKEKLSGQSSHRDNYRFLYYSEYPMGAHHEKSIWLEQDECYLQASDYNIPDNLKMILSSEHFIQDFVDFHHKCSSRYDDNVRQI